MVFPSPCAFILWLINLRYVRMCYSSASNRIGENKCTYQIKKQHHIHFISYNMSMYKEAEKSEKEKKKESF